MKKTDILLQLRNIMLGWCQQDGRINGPYCTPRHLPSRNANLTTIYRPEHFCKNHRIHLRSCNSPRNHLTENAYVEMKRNRSLILPMTPPPPSQHSSVPREMLLFLHFLSEERRAQGVKPMSSAFWDTFQRNLFLSCLPQNTEEFDIVGTPKGS